MPFYQGEDATDAILWNSWNDDMSVITFLKGEPMQCPIINK